MEGRIFMVTGATNGIGKHTATRLARAGATVLVHGRDQGRVDSTVRELKMMASNQNITGYVADLASMDAVRKLSDEVHATQTRIDVLINNAGVFEMSRKESADGHELTLAVNVLAPFLLTSLLRDLLRAGHRSQVVNVSSVSHREASALDLDNLQMTTNYGSGYTVYAQSKLCEIMFSFDMAERFRADEIRVNCLDPGDVNTQMLLKGWGAVGIPVEEANDVFRLATDDKFADITGEYFVNLTKTRAISVAYDQQMRSKLWEWLEGVTGAKF